MFGGAYYWRECGISNGLDGYSVEQFKTSTSNSPIGLIFGRAYYRKDIYVRDLGSLFSGGLIFEVAYRNLTVFPLW